MYTLRIMTSEDTQYGILSDYSKLQCNVEFSDVGGVSFDYAVRGENVHVLADQAELGVFRDGVEIPDTRFVVEGSNGSMIERDGVMYRSWSGRNLWKLFGESCVYPPMWPAEGPLGTVYDNKTPGYILSSLIDLSQDRGELPRITFNFSNATDSDGLAWEHTISATFEAGTSLMTIIKWMVEQGFIEARLQGRQLQVFNPGGLGQDRTTGQNPLVFWSDEPTQEVPEATDSRDLRTVALVIGDGGKVAEVFDHESIGVYGKRVLVLKQSGITDVGTLAALGQLNLDKVKAVRRERTMKVTVVRGLAQPMVDYIPGDWVFTQARHSGTPERMRIRQLVLDVANIGSEASVTMRLNDKFEELEVLLDRKIEGITGGSTLGGGTGGGVPVEEKADIVPPLPPTGLGISSSTYDQYGWTYAMLHATWNAPLLNSDGSALNDLDGYRLAWRYMNNPNDNTWHVWETGDTTSVTLTGLVPGLNVEAKVGAFDRNGNFSGYTATQSTQLAWDTSPPPTPSTPTLAPYLGQIRISWDGKSSTGNVMPTDFLHVEVHISPVNDFSPTASTLIGVMTGASTMIATDLDYGTPYYVKLIAVDSNQNKSSASTQATSTPSQVSGADLANGSVFLNHLAFSEVGNFIENGSFENEAGRTSRPVGGPWSFTQSDSYHGTWSIQASGVGTAAGSNNLISVPLTIRPGDDFMATFAVKLDATAWNSVPVNTAAVELRVTARLQDNTTETMTFQVKKQDLEPGVWAGRFSVKLGTPFEWKTIEEVRLWRTANVTAGAIWVDAMEFRLLMGSVHIANLAVNDAIVANLDVGKLTSGIVAADMILGGRIATDLIGDRVDMDRTGIRLFKGALTERTALDSFTRVNSGWWGDLQQSVPAGTTWTLAQWYGATWGGSAANYSVNGSHAELVLASVGTSQQHDARSARIINVTQDVVAEIDVYLPKLATGAAYKVGLFGRRASASPHAQMGWSANFHPDQTCDVTCFYVESSGNYVSLGTFSAGIYTPGWYRIKLRLTGTKNEFKIWRLGQDQEPSWWTIDNSAFPTTAGDVGVFATRMPGNTDANLTLKFDNWVMRGYETASRQTVRIATEGTIMLEGEFRTGGSTEKRIRIDANATFNGESGITFEDPAVSQTYAPTIFANYTAYDGASRGGLHLMSGEVTPNSTGRAELNLHKGGNWKLRTQYNANSDGVLEAGRFFFYGRVIHQGSPLSTQSFFTHRTIFGSAITGFTHTFGPTMATTPMVLITNEAGNLVRYQVDSTTTTAFHVTCENTVGGNMWVHMHART